MIASGKARFTLSDGFAANGYGDHSPAGYAMLAAIVIVFPIGGAVMAGLVYRYLLDVPKSARASLSPNALLLCSAGSGREAVSTA